MQRRGSAFIGFTIEANDGHVGRIIDILFDDQTWILRWFVVYVGSPWSYRLILLHPAALDRPDNLGRAFSVPLTKAQAKASREIQTDEPVSLQMKHRFSNGYDYSPTWGAVYNDCDIFGLPLDSSRSYDSRHPRTAAAEGDPHLRSLNEVKNYHVHALDGQIGHLTDFLIDDENWTIDCAVIDTRNWWLAKHVLLPAASIKEINWAARYVQVDLTRYKIQSSESWTKPDWSQQIDA